MNCETTKVAHTMLDMGLHPVQLKARSKDAYETGWTKRIHTHATVDAEFCDGDNVGVLLGELGGWVVDIDLDSVKALEVAQRILPPTLCFGRDGKPRSHYLFRSPGCRTVKRQVSDGLVELRSTGHQTMYVGSIHPNGERVRMETPVHPIRDIPSHELLHLVDRIARECGWTPPERKTVERVEPVRVSGGGYGAAALRKELAQLSAAREGGRNDQLNRAAFAVRQLVDAGELPPEAMEEVRMVALSTGLEEREVEATMRSAERGASAHPRAPRMTQQPPAKPTRAEVVQRSEGAVAEAVRMLEATQGRKVAGIPIPGFPVLTDALFGLSGTCLLTGPSGMGKTTLVNAIALNVARGTSRENEETFTPVPVVFISAEMPRSQVVANMVQHMAGRVSARTLQLGNGGRNHPGTMTERLLLDDITHQRVESAFQVMAEMERTNQLVVWNAAALMRPWTCDEHALIGLQEAVETLHPEGVLVVIDTLATLEVKPAEGHRHGSDLEADADIVSALVRWRESLGPRSAILAVHEESKAATGTGDGHSVRGSSRYLYSTTQRIAMIRSESEEGTRTLLLRTGEKDPHAREIDMVVSKARFGGKSDTMVCMTHHHTTGEFEEHAPLLTSDDLRAAREELKERRKEQKKQEKAAAQVEGEAWNMAKKEGKRRAESAAESARKREDRRRDLA